MIKTFNVVSRLENENLAHPKSFKTGLLLESKRIVVVLDTA